MKKAIKMLGNSGLYYSTRHSVLDTESHRRYGEPSPVTSCHPLPKVEGNRLAFTLAEVLITLGIIGVVAALTMPSLIMKYQKQETVTKLKKIYSTIAQSIELSKIEYDSIENWDWTLPPNEFFKKYMCTNCKILKDCQNLTGCWNPTGTNSLAGGLYANYDTDDFSYNMLLADGTALSFNKQDNSHMHITIDINGLKGPNTYGKDTFGMTMTKEAFSDDYHNIIKSGLYMFGHGLSAEELKTNTLGCAKDKHGLICGEKILFDNWQTANDYPW